MSDKLQFVDALTITQVNEKVMFVGRSHSASRLMQRSPLN